MISIFSVLTLRWYIPFTYLTKKVNGSISNEYDKITWLKPEDDESTNLK